MLRARGDRPRKKVTKYDDVPMCPKCLGYGWVRVYFAGEPDGSVDCNRCGGSGRA